MLKTLRVAADFSHPPRLSIVEIGKANSNFFNPRISSLPYSLHKHELHSGILMPHPHRLYTVEPCH